MFGEVAGGDAYLIRHVSCGIGMKRGRYRGGAIE